jgi:hypothetical protein
MENVLRNEKVYQFLEKVDEDLAFKAGSEGCEHCGGRLHRADYERKPRGGPAWDKRYSLCCSREGCRKRKTPASVRFLGRKVYAGIVVVVVTAMVHGANESRLKRLRQELPIDRRTLKRWREWWAETFVQSAFWKAMRGRFRRPIDPGQMPLGLVEAFDAEQRGGLVRLMKFLSPITTKSATEGLVM